MKLAGLLVLSGLAGGAPAAVPDATVPRLFDYGIKYLSSNNPLPGTMAYMPFAGQSYVPWDPNCTGTWTYQWTNNLPVAAYYLHSTQIFSTNSLSNGYACSNSIADTITWFTTNAQAPGIRLEYMMSDDEPYAGYSGTQAQSDTDVTNMVKLIRQSANTNVSSACIGNYADYPGTIDPINGSSRSSRNTFYLNSGLNIAQPNAYPYTTYTGYGPTVRAAYFWSSLVLVTYVKTNLPAGHLLFPWLDNTLTNNASLSPTRADNVALLGAVRMRGADGFCDLGGLTSIGCLYGWTDWDWLFHGNGTNQILNYATSESSGYQWSGFRVGSNYGFIFSNLGTSANSNSLPSFPNLPAESPVIPAGYHVAADYIDDPANIATNTIYLGRDGINHSLFIDTTATLANAINVAAPGTNPPALVTLGADLAGTYSPVFSGSITLSNNLVLRSVTNVTVLVSGGISGGYAVTNTGSGLVILSGTNSYTGGTSIGGGTLQISNPAAIGSGGISLPKTGTNTGTLQLAFTGSQFLFNTFNGFNSTTFTGDSTVPDIENISGTNLLTSALTVTSTGGNGVAIKATGGLLKLSGQISTTLTVRDVELNGAGNGLVNGVVADGSTNGSAIPFGLVKDGPGTWTLANANTYSGNTTVNKGTLLVNGSIGTGNVSVAAAATLGGSGTVNGSVSLSGALSPGPSPAPGTLTTTNETWDPGCAFLFQLNDATNTAGQDLLALNGSLNLQVTVANPCTLKLVSLTPGNLPGPVTNFSAAANYSWTLASASGGILNFNPAAFSLDTTGFSNAFTGTFSVNTNGNALVLDYAPPPLAAPMVGGYGPAGPGRFALNFSGASGQTYHVLASTNLLLPLTNWWVLTNGAFGSGLISFTDAAATNCFEFYRVTSP